MSTWALWVLNSSLENYLKCPQSPAGLNNKINHKRPGLPEASNNSTEFLRSLLPKSIGDVRPQSRNPDNYYNVKARTETFRSSFIPSSVKLWNSLDVCDRTLTYVDCLMKKPKPLLLYHGSRKSSVKHTQLRMKCSKLNFDLFSLHVIDSPACPCWHIREDSNHYLLQCPLYFQARNKIILEQIHLSGEVS